jgi:5-methylcytosine-specific restriction endonuclease McrA
MSKKRQRDKIYPERREQTYERAQGRCEAFITPQCTRQAEQIHHKAGRTGEDPHRLTNLLAVCMHCHQWIHANPSQSYSYGFMETRHAKRD